MWILLKSINATVFMNNRTIKCLQMAFIFLFFLFILVIYLDQSTKMAQSPGSQDGGHSQLEESADRQRWHEESRRMLRCRCKCIAWYVWPRLVDMEPRWALASAAGKVSEQSHMSAPHGQPILSCKLCIASIPWKRFLGWDVRDGLVCIKIIQS